MSQTHSLLTFGLFVIAFTLAFLSVKLDVNEIKVDEEQKSEQMRESNDDIVKSIGIRNKNSFYNYLKDLDEYGITFPEIREVDYWMKFKQVK